MLRRQRRVAAIVAGLWISGLPTQALACIVRPSPADIDETRFEAAVLAEVLRVETLPGRINGRQRWSAQAQSTHALFESPPLATFEFGDGRGGWTDGNLVADCEDERPRPLRGGVWVLYLMRWNGALRAVRAYPRETTARFDLRVAASPGPLATPAPSPPNPSSPEGDAPPLRLSDKGAPDGRLEGTWRLLSVDGVAPPSGKRWPGAFRLTFRLGEVTGRNACNGFFGPYRVTGARLETALGQTTSGCQSPAPDDWDEATMNAVRRSDLHLSAGGRELILRSPSGRTYLFRRQ